MLTLMSLAWYSGAFLIFALKFHCVLRLKLYIFFFLISIRRWDQLLGPNTSETTTTTTTTTDLFGEETSNSATENAPAATGQGTHPVPEEHVAVWNAEPGTRAHGALQELQEADNN